MTYPITIVIPKESVNDDRYLLTHFHHKDGDRVTQGEVIATFETSKSAVDLEASANGFIFYLAKEETEVVVGDPLALIAETADRPSMLQQTEKSKSADSARASSDVKFSKSAQELLARSGISASAFDHLQLVRVSDIQDAIDARERERRFATEILPNLPPAKANSIVIWGSGGHARVLIDLIRAAREFEVYGLLDDFSPTGSVILGVTVLGRFESAPAIFDAGVKYAALGIGLPSDNVRRGRLYKRLADVGFDLPNLVHPNASVESSAILGKGNQVFAHATIGSAVVVGDGCIVNSGAVISHDCHLSDNTHIAPGATLAGMVFVGRNTLVGLGANLHMHIKVGENVVINNGANVNGDIPDGTIVRVSRN